jgi:hypothetical protein
VVTLSLVRIWTVTEAREYLPRARQLVELLRDAVAVAGRAKGNGHGTAPVEEPALSIQDAMVELEAGDIIVRDPERGLIDFPARGEDGVLYYLCWITTEDDLEWWHLPEEGFAGRKRLPRDG